MFRLMRNVRSEVSSDNTMPGGTVLLVKLLLDVCRNVFFDIVLLESLRSHINSILLHIFAHVRILDNSLALAHIIES